MHIGARRVQFTPTARSVVIFVCAFSLAEGRGHTTPGRGFVIRRSPRQTQANTQKGKMLSVAWLW